jgi:hypothetical protein
MAEPVGKQSGRRAYRLAFLAVAGIVLLVLLLLPFALNSVYWDVVVPSGERRYPLTSSDDQPAPTYSRLRVDVVAIDEVNQLATLRVEGVHVCRGGCDAVAERLVLFSVPAEAQAADRISPSESVTLPSTSGVVSQKLQLPVRGSLSVYPLDGYELWLGVGLERTSPDGRGEPLTPDEARGRLFLTVGEQIPRMVMQPPVQIDPRSVQPAGDELDVRYLAVADLHWQRPAYLKILCMLTILLSAAASAYAVFMRPFDQLILNSGALILGVWGVRSLLLGGIPQDITRVDVALTSIIMFLLSAITFRALNYLHRRAELTLLPWARPEPETET